MSIILFLLNGSSICWLSGHPCCIQLNLLLYRCFTCYQHLLELSCLSLGFGNGLNMFSIFIYSWIFSSLFLGLVFFLLCVSGEFCFSFGLGHLGPWLVLREQLGSSSGNGGGMVGHLGIGYLQLLPCCGTSWLWSDSLCGLYCWSSSRGSSCLNSGTLLSTNLNLGLLSLNLGLGFSLGLCLDLGLLLG